jgi:hypothetical protein
MKIVCYLLDDETAAGIKDIAKKSKMSSSDVVRSMYTRMHLDNTLQDMQYQSASFLEKLGLYTEDDVANYAKSKT